MTIQWAISWSMNQERHEEVSQGLQRSYAVRFGASAVPSGGDENGSRRDMGKSGGRSRGITRQST